MRIICFFLFLFIQELVFAQKSDSLANVDILPIVSNDINRSSFKINPQSVDFQDLLTSINNYKIVISNQDTLLVENGSGHIFILTQKLNSIKRIDQSKGIGYCFGASIFSYKDTVYSVGGYGYWQLNGIVRYFDKTTKEWAVKQTNLDIPFAEGINAITWFDKKRGVLYVFYQTISKETVSRPHINAGISLAELNINTAYWKIHSELINKEWAEQIGDFSEITEGPKGIIVHSKKSPVGLYLNLEELSVDSVQDNFFIKKKQLTSSQNNYLSYWKEDTLCIYNFSSDSTFRILLSKSGNKYGLLSKPKWFSNISIKHIYIDIVLILVLLALIFYTLIKRNKTNYSIEVDKSYKIKFFIEALTETEKETLSVIIKNSSNNLMTSIDEINKALKITNRPYKIQNNIRAEVISEINKKYCQFSEMKEELITRKRATFDKRFREYQINSRLLKKFL